MAERCGEETVQAAGGGGRQGRCVAGQGLLPGAGSLPAHLCPPQLSQTTRGCLLGLLLMGPLWLPEPLSRGSSVRHTEGSWSLWTQTLFQAQASGDSGLGPYV